MSNPNDPIQPPPQQPQPAYQPPPSYQPAPTYPPPPGYQTAPPPQPGQSFPSAPPVQPQYGYGQMAPTGVPQGMFFDPASGLTLPNGTELASVGRRIGAYFLSGLLAIVTLGIGYIIWGLIAWSRGTSPALSVLGMKVWRPADNKPASWGYMALRDIIGTIADSILSIITGLISFIMFVSGKQHQSLHDLVAGTVVLYDPNKVLG
jgi:uncharacterized RDD family membrane protein YckC